MSSLVEDSAQTINYKHNACKLCKRKLQTAQRLTTLYSSAASDVYKRPAWKKEAEQAEEPTAQAKQPEPEEVPTRGVTADDYSKVVKIQSLARGKHDRQRVRDLRASRAEQAALVSLTVEEDKPVITPDEPPLLAVASSEEAPTASE